MHQELGQHFLKSKSAIKKIVESLELKPGDTVIEIGSGHGELTEELRVLGIGCRVIAIEKDGRLTQVLQKKFAGDRKVKVVEGDALKILKSPHIHDTPYSKPYKLLGNIPYYITGKLLRILSESPKKPEVCVFTIQKEVAERIVAGPPKMNRLAAIVQFWAEPKIVGIIPRKDFYPEPAVDSAIIKLVTRETGHETGVSDTNYYKTVKMLFAQPRKTILNNLAAKGALGSREAALSLFAKLEITPTNRPGNLNVEDIEKVSLIVAKIQKKSEG